MVLIKKVFFTAIFIFVVSSSLSAQLLDEEAEADSVSSTLVPAVSYSSDEGVIGGILYDRKNFKGNIQPFRSRLKGKALASTLGFIDRCDRLHRRPPASETRGARCPSSLYVPAPPIRGECSRGNDRGRRCGCSGRRLD